MQNLRPPARAAPESQVRDYRLAMPYCFFSVVLLVLPVVLLPVPDVLPEALPDVLGSLLAPLLAPPEVAPPEVAPPDAPLFDLSSSDEGVVVEVAAGVSEPAEPVVALPEVVPEVVPEALPEVPPLIEPPEAAPLGDVVALPEVVPAVPEEEPLGDDDVAPVAGVRGAWSSPQP